jgi:hypothetical protein
MKLPQLAAQFEEAVEELDAKDSVFTGELRVLVKSFVASSAALVGDYQLGEIPALLHLCGAVLTALAAEAELSVETDDAGRRRARYRREQATLNLLALCCAVVDFHADRRNGEALKVSVADALAELVPPRD